MAQSHNTPTPAADTAVVFAYADNSLFMSVSGYIGILPWRQLSDDPELNILANKGVARVLITPAQAHVEKLAKDGKTHAEISASLQTFLAAGKANTRGDMQTVGAKRVELLTVMLQAALDKAGKKVNEATFAKLLGDYGVKHKARVDAELATWLTTYVKPTPNKARGTAAATTETIDESVSVDDL